jgi:hypothetical protein
MILNVTGVWVGYSVFNVQCSVYSVQCTVYSVPCTVFSVQCTVFSLQCSVYSVQCTVYSVQCTVYSVQCTVYSVQCTVYSVQCSVFSVQCTVLLVRFHDRSSLLLGPSELHTRIFPTPAADCCFRRRIACDQSTHVHKSLLLMKRLSFDPRQYDVLHK